MGAIRASDPQGHTPVTSYIPLGAHDSPLPMGKYYPSNYEKRNTTGNQHSRPPATARSPYATQSDSQTPKHKLDSPHSRMDSDVKRRLQQYQRDMIAQASQAASEVLGGSTKLGSSSLTGSTSIPDGTVWKNIQLGGSMVHGHKPLSPRLLPLGSPGPVTPIDLEGGLGGDSYLTRGVAVAGTETGQEQEAAALSVRGEGDRRRVREGGISPVPSH